MLQIAMNHPFCLHSFAGGWVVYQAVGCLSKLHGEKSRPRLQGASKFYRQEQRRQKTEPASVSQTEAMLMIRSFLAPPGRNTRFNTRCRLLYWHGCMNVGVFVATFFEIPFAKPSRPVHDVHHNADDPRLTIVKTNPR